MEQKLSEPPPSYSHAVHGQSSSGYAVQGQSLRSPDPAPTDVHGPVIRGPDIAYLKSVGGIVKITEAVSETVI